MVELKRDITLVIELQSLYIHSSYGLDKIVVKEQDYLFSPSDGSCSSLLHCKTTLLC
jgi:hypothetical protein